MSSVETRKSRRLALDALMLAVALILSYVEHLFPIGLLLPLPGFKLGLANIAVVLVLWRLSPTDAAIVSFLRVAVVGLLFGNLVSFWISFGGALLSWIMLSLLRHNWLKMRMSFWGISVLSATAHNLGQLLCASVLWGFSVFSTYAPVLLVAAAIFGSVSGFLLNVLYPILERKANVG